MKSAVYKESLFCPAVNYILLLVSHIQTTFSLYKRRKSGLAMRDFLAPVIVHLIFPCTSLKKYTCWRLAHSQLSWFSVHPVVLFTMWFCSFTSSLWHCSFSYERSPVLHKMVMLAPCMELYFKYMSTFTVYDCVKMNSRWPIRRITYNPSILLICILKVNHQI